MARWRVLPKDWDRLTEYDRLFMMAFIDAEQQIEAVSRRYGRGKAPTFILPDEGGETDA